MFDKILDSIAVRQRIDQQSGVIRIKSLFRIRITQFTLYSECLQSSTEMHHAVCSVRLLLMSGVKVRYSVRLHDFVTE